MSPKILLDEPTSGIDPLYGVISGDRLLLYQSEEQRLLATTHFMDESEYCDRIMIQDAGKLVVLGKHLMKLDGLPAMRIVLWMKRLSPSY